MSESPLSYRFLGANEHQESSYTVVLFHGTGGDENDLIQLGEDLTNGQANLLGVRGNVLENGVTNRFFRRLGTGVFDYEDLHFRTDEIRDTIQTIARKHQLDESKLIGLGYSNGANIAGALLQKYPDFLCGAVLWRAMLPFPNERPSQSNQAPVLITSGSADPYYRPSEMKTYEELLHTAGFQVSHQLIPTSHNLTQNDLQLTKAWLQEHFSFE